MTTAAGPEVPHRPVVRSLNRVLGAVVLVGILVAAGIGGWRWHQDRSYIGTSRAVTIEWRCLDHLDWRDEERDATWTGGTQGVRPITVERGSFPPVQMATGTIRFDTYDRATFTSDLGGSTELHRVPPGAFRTLACVLK
jgi:hypothetical protein